MEEPNLASLKFTELNLAEPAIRERLSVLSHRCKLTTEQQETTLRIARLTERRRDLQKIARIPEPVKSAFTTASKDFIKTDHVSDVRLTELEKLLDDIERHVAESDARIQPLTRAPDNPKFCCATEFCARKISKTDPRRSRAFCDHHKELVAKHPKVCSIPGCIYKRVIKNMCGLHAERSATRRTSSGRRAIHNLPCAHTYRCRESGCAAQMVEKGFCARHMPRGLCSAATCLQPASRDGLCNTHFRFPHLVRTARFADLCLCDGC
jgi:hypothetical protein